MLVEVVLLAATAGLVWWPAQWGRRPGLGALALTVGVVVAVALGAHDAGQSPRWLFVPLEIVHLGAAGAWQGLAQVSSRAALADTDYGRVLAVKAAAFLAVLGLAALVRFRLLPRAGTGWKAGQTPGGSAWSPARSAATCSRSRSR